MESLIESPIELMSAYHDPLGFNKEVSAMFEGFGASNLRELKNRNICMDDLINLTEEDLKQLNMGENFNLCQFNRMRENLKKKSNTLSHHPTDILSILISSRKQLETIIVYYEGLIVCSHKMTDYFIDLDRYKKVSDALLLGINSLLNELTFLEEAINCFESVKILEMPSENNCIPKKKIFATVLANNHKKKFKTKYITTAALLRVFGLGLISVILIRKYFFK